jgi:hypothetical protein
MGIVMQALQDFEASIAAMEITDQGDVLATFLTDKGHIAVLMRRVVLEQLYSRKPRMNCSAFRARGGSDNYRALWLLDELVGQTSK